MELVDNLAHSVGQLEEETRHVMDVCSIPSAPVSQEEVRTIFFRYLPLVPKGIIHVFSCINICLVSKLFEFEAARLFKHVPRDLENVNAMKQRCMIVILAYLLIPLLKRIENTVKLLKLLYLYVE